MTSKSRNVWIRVGDAGEYEPFFDMAEALEYLNELRVGNVTGWIEGGPGVGFETPNFHGYDFISCFIGDCHADLIRPLSARERVAVEAGLEEAFI